MRTETFAAPLQRDTVASPPSRAIPPAPPVRVYMMDLLSIVPYYTGHLASALEERGDVRLRVGAITYYLDREYFARQKFDLDPGLNVVSRFAIRPPGVRRALKLFEYLFNVCALLARCSGARPSVLHVQFLPMLCWGIPVELWFLRVAKLLGIRIVYTVHNVLPQGTGDRRRKLYRKLYAVPDALVCHDRAAQDRLTNEFGVARNRTTVIPHGPLFTPSAELSAEKARQELGIPENQVLVLWQGILRPYKGVPFLLKAWQRVQHECPAARLIIVGPADSASARAVVDEVQSLGLGPSVRVDFRFAPEREVRLFYAAADILVYPYSEITTSGALMTGLGYGKAIVTTRLDAFQSVLRNGRDALMVDYGDVNALAETLLTLAAQPGLRNELGAAAKRTFGESQGWSEIAASTSALYRAVAGS